MQLKIWKMSYKKGQGNISGGVLYLRMDSALVISETKHLFKDRFSASHFRNKTFIKEQLITRKWYTPSPSNVINVTSISILKSD